LKFAIFTHVVHKRHHNLLYAYAPYVREMNLWIKYVDEVEIIAPFSSVGITSIESEYNLEQDEQIPHQVRNDVAYRHAELDSASVHSALNDEIPSQAENDESERHSKQREAISSNKKGLLSNNPYYGKSIKLIEIQAFDLTSLKNGINAIFKIPNICYQIFKYMKWADHIHLRCPGNIGFLATIVQILFPSKPKTIKYAGNWDSNSSQPLSYRFQKWILSNVFLTRNAKVLVYGEWPNQSKNIIPFFTASYSENEIRHPALDAESSKIRLNFIYVGGLTSGKQPLLSVQVINSLKGKGYHVHLDIYGEGLEREKIKKYVADNSLENEVVLYGNTSKEIVKKAYQKAHFLLFVSKSEGWPKVVAEAMFWGCIPITSRVSCVPWMLAEGKRGLLVDNNIDEIVSAIERLLTDKEGYRQMSLDAQKWSQQYTLEYFEKEISKILIN